MSGFISFEEAGLWWLTVPPGLPRQEAGRVHAFSRDRAETLWRAHISTQRHPMLAAHRGGMGTLSEIPYCWMEDWNADRAGGLASRVGWLLPMGERVWFFWSAEHGVETAWEVFLRCWIQFLMEDEGPLLFAPRTGLVLLFAPNGMLFQGYRK